MAATCNSCGARIQWAVHATSGKRIPLDDFYVETGVRFTIDGTGQAHTVTDPLGDGRPSHFASCPNADQHRRAR